MLMQYQVHPCFPIIIIINISFIIQISQNLEYHFHSAGHTCINPHELTLFISVDWNSLVGPLHDSHSSCEVLYSRHPVRCYIFVTQGGFHVAMWHGRIPGDMGATHFLRKNNHCWAIKKKLPDNRHIELHLAINMWATKAICCLCRPEIICMDDDFELLWAINWIGHV